MNRPIRYLAVACLVLFVALLANINYVQFVQADSLNAKNGNRRVINEEFSRDRGADPRRRRAGRRERPERRRVQVPAPLHRRASCTRRSPATSPTFRTRRPRELPEPRSCPAATTGCSSTASSTCSSNKQPKGGSVETTLDPLAQKAAASGLEALGEDTKGAVVALDPSTGAILAMVTPAVVQPQRPGQPRLRRASSDDWRRLTTDEDQPMLNRGDPADPAAGLDVQAGHRRGGPGEPRHSTRATWSRPAAPCRSPASQYKLTNHDNGNCGGNRITFERALNVSCNVSFGCARRQGRPGRPGGPGPQVRLRHRHPGRPRRRTPAASPPRAPTSRRRSSRSPASGSSRSPRRRCRWRWSPAASATAAT